MKTILRWFFKPKGEFETTPKGLKMAKFWSRLQKHPNSKKSSLYSYIYSLRLDGWENIHNINKYKKKNFNY